MLLACAMVMSIAFLFLWGAWNGLASTVGQQHAMSGQMSAIWNFAGTSSMVMALIAGGVLSGILEDRSANGAVRTLFLIAAAFMAAMAGLGLWKPASVFYGLRGQQRPIDTSSLTFCASFGTGRSIRRLSCGFSGISRRAQRPCCNTICRTICMDRCAMGSIQRNFDSALRSCLCAVRVSEPEILACELLWWERLSAYCR